ncbi:MAG: PAS domain S-box protein [Candidatus Methylacidiphilales bacterium]
MTSLYIPAPEAKVFTMPTETPLPSALAANLKQEALDAFIENFPGMAWILDEKGLFIRCNAAFCAILEQDPKRLLGRSVEEALGKELGDICQNSRSCIMATGETQKFIQTIKKSDGTQFKFLIHEFPIPLPQGGFHYAGLGVDITSQLETEAALRENEERLNRLNRLYSVLSRINEIMVRNESSENLCQSVCRIIRQKAKIDLAWIARQPRDSENVSCIASYGPHKEYADAVDIRTTEPQESSGPAARALRTGVYSVSNCIADDPHFRHKELASQHRFQSCGAFPFEFENKDRGILLVYSCDPHYFGNEECHLFQSLADDLSYALHANAARIRMMDAQQELEKNQRRMQNLFQNLPGMAYRCRNDEFWTMEFTSEGSFELTGYLPTDLLDNRTISFLELTHPDDREWARRDVNLALSRRTRFELTYRIIHRTKGERWVWERGCGVFVNGNLSHIEGFISDVTDQQNAYTRLQTQAHLIDQARDAIIVSDGNGYITSWNQGAARLYGYSAREAKGQLMRDLLKTRGDLLDDAVREVRRTGEWTGELVRIGADGRAHTVDSRWTVVLDPEGGGASILTIDTDITERLELEKQFLRAQRMESVGNLAAGIAHDLNNILSPIMMSADLLDDQLTEPNDRSMVRRIRDGSQRAAHLVQQLLSFSRGLDSSRRPLDLRQHRQILTDMIQDSLPSSVTLDLEIQEDLAPIRANFIQIQQVLLNLCVNARDAMKGKGQLRVFIHQEKRFHVPPGISPGKFVVLEVSDNGCGIPEHLRDQIFEPFFSTKSESEGTGLGLTTTVSIVRHHEGFIDLKSSEQVGTTFKVYLPALGMLMEEKISEATNLSQGEGHTVLVVDDDPSMRSVISQVLEQHGYQVETAADGKEALEILRVSDRMIDMTLTDLSMPVMDGLSLRSALMELYPSMPVIGMSGFEQSQLTEGDCHPKAEFSAFLFKPFSQQQLLSSLRDHLSGPCE